MNRPTLRIRPDGDESVILLDMFDGEVTGAIPVGVGPTVADAIRDARVTLLSVLAAVDEVIEEMHAAGKAWAEGR